MATITNPSADNWDIPLYGVQLAPGESFEIPETPAAEGLTPPETPSAVGTDTIEPVPDAAPVAPAGE